MIQPFLVAVDMSALTDVVLERAIALAEGQGNQLDLLHVVKPPQVHARGPSARAIYEQALKERQEGARAKLAKLMERVPEPQRGKLLVDAGIPADVICDHAKDGYSMVVLATKGLSGLQHTLLGSVAERVVRFAPTPVLVVR